MTLNLAQARADWDDAIDRTADGEWARQYAEPLLTALEARSGDMELAERIETAVYFAERHKAKSALWLNADEWNTILKALKGGV